MKPDHTGLQQPTSDLEVLTWAALLALLVVCIIALAAKLTAL